MILICQTRIKFCKQVIYWKRNLNNFAIKIINDEVYYMKYYYLTWLWWKILYIFFPGFYIFVCCIPNYTMFVYLLEIKKTISFSYIEDLMSRCVHIHIKVDNFVYMYITYFRIKKIKIDIFIHRHMLYGFF